MNNIIFSLLLVSNILCDCISWFGFIWLCGITVTSISVTVTSRSMTVVLDVEAELGFYC